MVKKTEERTKTIKVAVSEKEQRSVRMAAAEANQTMAAFARTATLKAAKHK